MHDLSLAPLMQSVIDGDDDVHIWKPSKAGAKNVKGEKAIYSHASDDVDDCLKARKKGASLYFSSPAEFRNSYGKALSYQMGYDFAGYFPGSSSGESPGDCFTEIEVFISKKGNYTDWHLDRQENITFQLKGSKKWRLKTEPGMEAPVLGFSPHYADYGNLEA